MLFCASASPKERYQPGSSAATYRKWWFWFPPQAGDLFFCDITTKYLDLQTRIQWLRSNYNSTEKLMKPRKITAKSGLPAAIAAMDFGIGLCLGAMAAASQ